MRRTNREVSYHKPLRSAMRCMTLVHFPARLGLGRIVPAEHHAYGADRPSRKSPRGTKSSFTTVNVVSDTTVIAIWSSRNPSDAT